MSAAPIDRLMEAAKEFCSAECELSERRKREKPRCTEAEEPDMQCGDPGQDVCWRANSDEETWCEACRKRIAGNEIFMGALRRRRLAKAKMLRAYRRLAGV